MEAGTWSSPTPKGNDRGAALAGARARQKERKRHKGQPWLVRNKPKITKILILTHPHIKRQENYYFLLF